MRTWSMFRLNALAMHWATNSAAFRFLTLLGGPRKRKRIVLHQILNLAGVPVEYWTPISDTWYPRVEDSTFAAELAWLALIPRFGS